MISKSNLLLALFNGMALRTIGKMAVAESKVVH